MIIEKKHFESFRTKFKDFNYVYNVEEVSTYIIIEYVNNDVCVQFKAEIDTDQICDEFGAVGFELKDVFDLKQMLSYQAFLFAVINKYYDKFKYID
jgi:uncharacterized protein Smg (DUF494 family)